MADVQRNPKQGAMPKITRKQLLHRHKEYSRNKKLWDLYMAAYKGVDAIITGNYIKQHSREEDKDYQRRMDHLYSFAYSESVVGIYTYHLMSQPPVGRTIKDIESDEVFDMFWKDADLEGNDFDKVMARIALFASVQGHMGILIDKPAYQADNRQDQIDKGLHPYMAVYHPAAILDWKIQRNPETHRPELVFLKLLEGDDKVKIWWKEGWALFSEEDSKDIKAGGNPYPSVVTTHGTSSAGTTGAKPAPGAIPIAVQADTGTGEAEEMVQAIDAGINPLGEIPFVWYYNQESDKKGMGKSDLSEISRIDISLVLNASQIEEIINFAAFPMMMKPKRDASPKGDAGSQQEDEVGITAVIEYDPEYPESKPEWLTPEVESAIRAILSHMQSKVSEIYRAANIGGLAATEVSTAAKSGTALKSEFQILNSKLVSKATNLEKSENKIIEFFLKWEDRWKELKDKVHMGRSKNFNIEDIATDLANALTAKEVVVSDTFNILMQKQVSRQILPSASEDDQATIDTEIEEGVQAQKEAEAKMKDIDAADDDIIDNPNQIDDVIVERN